MNIKSVIRDTAITISGLSIGRLFMFNKIFFLNPFILLIPIALMVPNAVAIVEDIMATRIV